MRRYRLKDIASIYSGATPSTCDSSNYDGGNISWITPKDLSNYTHKYIFNGQRNITQKGYDSCATHMLPKGSILFSSRAPIGYIAIAGKDLCTNQGFKNIVCNSELISNHYLYYFLIKNKGKLEALGNGSTFKELSQRTLAEFPVELPSLEEQQKAVRRLIRLDDKYDSNCSIMKSLDEMMRHMYILFFEKKCKRHKTVKLGDVATITTGGTPSTKNEAFWNNGIYDWYTPSDITQSNLATSLGANKKISALGLANSNAKVIPPNSVLMTSRATIGEATINMFEATTNQGILAIIPNYNNITTLQLYYWVVFNKEKIKSIANGSTFKEVYKSDLEKLPVQIRNDECFSNDASNLFELYKSLIIENKTIVRLKKRIIDAIF